MLQEDKRTESNCNNTEWPPINGFFEIGMIYQSWTITTKLGMLGRCYMMLHAWKFRGCRLRNNRVTRWQSLDPYFLFSRETNEPFLSRFLNLENYLTSLLQHSSNIKCKQFHSKNHEKIHLGDRNLVSSLVLLQWKLLLKKLFGYWS